MAARPVLLSCESVSKQFGSRSLFRDLSLVLHEGDHVGLVGPNGSGKSTLLSILAGTLEPDSGSRSLRKGLRLGYVPQEPAFAVEQTAEEAVTAALDGAPLEDYEKASRVVQVLGRLGFGDTRQTVSRLSGGWRKRLAIARELVREPDVLLLDEPTNHLDLEGIVDLETLLEEEPRAFVVVSHDRYFLENVAKRMIEIDRVYPSGLLEVEGPYSALLEKRDEVRRNQADYQEALANRARRELEWLRRGPKARRTKAKYRVTEAERLQVEVRDLKARSVEADVGIDFTASGRKTKKLLAARGLAKSFGSRLLFSGVDLLLRPGSRLGLLGPNGSGKSTLIGLLGGTVEPDEGEIERAPQLSTVVFEQGRESLDPTASLRRALAPEGDTLVFQGRPLHVASWARRFLFRSEQLEVPVAQLSGGERARVAIARLMLRSADLLILDEPTNDLDIATLEVLEESLLDFPGALVLVTHDRYLLDRVCTSILALDGRGGVASFADTSQWEEHRASVTSAEKAPPKPAPPETVLQRSAAPAKPKKLSWAEQREWEGLEEAVLAAEERLQLAQAALEDPAVATQAAALASRLQAVEGARSEVDRLYARWAELEEKRG